MLNTRHNFFGCATDGFPIWNHRLAGKLQNHGGWSFVFPPTLPTSTHPAIWRASDTPAVIIFQNEPGNGNHLSIPPMFNNHEIVQDRITTAGRHLVVCDGRRRHRFLLTPPGPSGSGYLIPRDQLIEPRIAALEDFNIQSRLTELVNYHDALCPSVYQNYRLALLLRIFDAANHSDEGSATMREIAQNVIYRHTDLGRAIEWKSSSQRRQTQRLLNEARKLVHGGYRVLLKGKSGAKAYDLPIKQ